MTPSPSARRKDLLRAPTLLEGLKAWLQSMNDASASDVAVRETLEKPAEAPPPVEGSARLQSGATIGIFTLLVFHFLYFASPILVPIITALLLSMLLVPFVRLLELVRVPRTLGSLIVVVAPVAALVGVAASFPRPGSELGDGSHSGSPVLRRGRVQCAFIRRLCLGHAPAESGRELRCAYGCHR